ncbi:MAG: adenylate/guanylate cyclase domain-containing protein [Prochlorothrix sp.]
MALSDGLKFMLSLARSPLAQKVTWWVFWSLVAVEVVIFIPSYQNRKQEYLDRLAAVSNELLLATRQEATTGEDMKALFAEFSRQFNPESVVEGGALYKRTTGERVSAFGEVPPLFAIPNTAQDPIGVLTRTEQRYDVASLSVGFTINDQYVIVVRHDASGLAADLRGYGLRVAGLVVLIATVVTGTTLVVVGQLVIGPVLQLRRDFLRAGEIVTQPYPNQNIALETQAIQQQDEMGDVVRSFQNLFQRTCSAIQARSQTEEALREAQLKSEQLLLNILPATIAEQLKQGQRAIAENFEQVTILFVDLVNFTCLSTQMPASDLVCLLNEIFSRFDALVEHYGLEKIKTIGDAYMVVGGVPTPHPDAAGAMVQLALAVRSALDEFNQAHHSNLQVRIGINTGPVVAGVIGIKKFTYDLWGDAVNIASRMESHGIPGKIQVSAATYALVGDRFPFEHRGTIAVKGRGTIETYLL